MYHIFILRSVKSERRRVARVGHFQYLIDFMIAQLQRRGYLMPCYRVWNRELFKDFFQPDAKLGPGFGRFSAGQLDFPVAYQPFNFGTALVFEPVVKALFGRVEILRINPNDIFMAQRQAALIHVI